jgi:hypothetical protein
MRTVIPFGEHALGSVFTINIILTKITEEDVINLSTEFNLSYHKTRAGKHQLQGAIPSVDYEDYYKVKKNLARLSYLAKEAENKYQSYLSFSEGAVGKPPLKGKIPLEPIACLEEPDDLPF